MQEWAYLSQEIRVHFIHRFHRRNWSDWLPWIIGFSEGTIYMHFLYFMGKTHGKRWFLQIFPSQSLQWIHMAVCQNLVPLVNIKIAGKWMFIPLKMVSIGIDPSPYEHCNHAPGLWAPRLARFLDGQSFFRPPEISVLLRALQRNRRGERWILWEWLDQWIPSGKLT